VSGKFDASCVVAEEADVAQSGGDGAVGADILGKGLVAAYVATFISFSRAFSPVAEAAFSVCDTLADLEEALAVGTDVGARMRRRQVRAAAKEAMRQVDACTDALVGLYASPPRRRAPADGVAGGVITVELEEVTDHG
jgi:hypothetical protein